MMMLAAAAVATLLVSSASRSDAQTQPILSIESNGTVVEGTAATFTVTLSERSATDVTFYYYTGHSNSSASEDDFTGIYPPTLITISAGNTTAPISIATNDDSLDEADSEMFEVRLAGPFGAIFSKDDASAEDGTIFATGTITDDDDPPLLKFTLPEVTNPEDSSTTLQGVSEYAKFLSITVHLVDPVDEITPAASGREVSFRYETMGDTAVAYQDYVPVGEITETYGLTTFAAGQKEATFAIRIINDEIHEDRKKFYLRLYQIQNVATLEAPRLVIEDRSPTDNIERIYIREKEIKMQMFIVDDDVTDPPVLSVESDGPVVEGNAATFTVTLSPSSATDVAFDYSTGPSSATDDHDASDDDYTATTGTSVTIAAGQTTATVSIATNDDSLDEADSEMFEVFLTNPSGATVSASDGSATGAIIDNDDPPTVSISAGTGARKRPCTGNEGNTVSREREDCHGRVRVSRCRRTGRS